MSDGPEASGLPQTILPGDPVPISCGTGDHGARTVACEFRRRDRIR